ncbi:hypothetical protein [Fodinicola feengrottensis]|uniref:Uncharacterized protein n=1 Tax=Fodinicola feengrottensis TaxID=435914 RepID=A0ABP4TRZ4_9ACTN|nr:hypothetical protein [Fodinicola feengrottensis]
MIYEVVEVLSQRPPETAPLFDAVVEAFGWDPLPRRAEVVDRIESHENSEGKHQAVEEKLDDAPAVVVSITKKALLTEGVATVLPEPAPAPQPDTSQPRTRVRKPRPRKESEPRTVSLIRSA